MWLKKLLFFFAYVNTFCTHLVIKDATPEMTPDGIHLDRIYGVIDQYRINDDKKAVLKEFLRQTRKHLLVAKGNRIHLAELINTEENCFNLVISNEILLMFKVNGGRDLFGFNEFIKGEIPLQCGNKRKIREEILDTSILHKGKESSVVLLNKDNLYSEFTIETDYTDTEFLEVSNDTYRHMSRSINISDILNGYCRARLCTMKSDYGYFSVWTTDQLINSVPFENYSSGGYSRLEEILSNDFSKDVFSAMLSLIW